MKLDQYYTHPRIAQLCWRLLQKQIPDTPNITYIEPSAGTGNFYFLLPDGRKTAVDIDPTHPQILPANFLTWQPPKHTNPTETIIIGNPPYGHRNNTAIQFLNKAAAISSTIAFILPVTFLKYQAQKCVPQQLKLAASHRLPKQSFYTSDSKPYSINTHFQIWTSLPHIKSNLRKHKPEPISHAHFRMFQYNNTPDGLKFFDNDFDFAVLCQGWQDYTRKESDAASCERNKQWIMFKAGSPEALRILESINYQKLAHTVSTITPGFRKNDIVTEYERILCQSGLSS